MYCYYVRLQRSDLGLQGELYKPVCMYEYVLKVACIILQRLNFTQGGFTLVPTPYLF